MTKSELAPSEPLLTSELTEYITSWKDRPGNLIMVLHRVQEEFGYIPREAAFEVAALLDIPLARIYGVLTFYNFFKLTKPGTYNIQVCMGTACYLKGAEDLIIELERLLGVGLNTVSACGLFSVEAVRCVGCCGLAPVLVINGEVYGGVKSRDLAKILDKYRDL